MPNSVPKSNLIDDRVERVLVADDEEKYRRMLRDILQIQGREVRLAEDGQQALEMAFADRPDAILLDVMMPKMDGYEVCRQLRQDPRTAHIPILLITALKDRADRLNGIKAGASDFLTKPVDVDEIRLRVANAVLVSRLYEKVQKDYARLKELESLRDSLMKFVVHDMRSPLMVIEGSYDIVSMEAERLSPTQQQFVAMGRNSCRELVEMANSLLDVSRMEAGRMPLNPVPCEVREIARETVEAMTVLAREKTLSVQIDGDAGAVKADRDIMRRVFNNLLGNAIKFSPASGAIRIEIVSTGATVRVAVTDQGPGIPPKYHAKIFEKFGQVESRQEGQKHSTGLGLTFCKLAVEAHGGEIGVISEAGKGSSFWFVLPAAPK